MNGKSGDMDYKFAIKVLSCAKVETPPMHGNPKPYSYQNQRFYDIARKMATQALKEKYDPKINEEKIQAIKAEAIREFVKELENKAKTVGCDEMYDGQPLYVSMDDIQNIEEKFLRG